MIPATETPAVARLPGGALPYTLAEFGLGVDQVRDAFREYTQHFAIRLEA